MSTVYKRIKIDGSGGGGGGSTFDFYISPGAPSGAFGTDGDIYLNSTTSDLYKKSGGSWSLQANIKGNTGATGSTGATGATGAAGSQIYSGVGAPAGGLGVNTDFYVNSTNGDYYLKTGGSWVLQGSLKGPTGATGAAGANGTNGATWRNGSGTPSNSLGVDGDFYLDNSTGSYYKKVTGSYVLQGSLAYTSLIGNIDGGTPSTNYGGIAPIDGGSPSSF